MKAIFIFLSIFLLIGISKQATGDCNDSVDPGTDEEKCFKVEIEEGKTCCYFEYKTDDSSTLKKYACRGVDNEIKKDDDKTKSAFEKLTGWKYEDHDCSSRFISSVATVSFVVGLVASIM